MSIKTRVADLAKKRGETIAEVERKLGLGNGTISKWDRRSPSSGVLKVVADHFNVSTDYLLGRSDSQTEDDLKTADLADNDVIFTYQGKPLSDEDKELIRRLMNGK